MELIGRCKLKNGNFLLVYEEDNLENPRKDDRNIGSMVCFHSRYELPYEIEQSIDICDDWDVKEAKLRRLGYKTILPLYLLVRSGLYMSVEDFCDSLNSRQVGFIVCYREPSKKVVDALRKEVALYDKYLRDKRYRYKLVRQVQCDKCGHIEDEVIEECGGFLNFKEILTKFCDEIVYLEKDGIRWVYKSNEIA